MGGQAQVVTFALDWLLAHEIPISQVVVLHLSPQDPRVRQALEQLTTEFRGEQYGHASRPMRFRALPIPEGNGALLDVRSESAAESIWQFVYQLLTELKREGQLIDLCIAGGRRMMGLMALSAAMLLFGHQDRVWHLYTPDELRERAADGAIRHVAPDEGMRLIQVPLVPWGAYFPSLRDLAGVPATQVLNLQRRQLDTQEQTRCQNVVAQLTRRQRAVLRLLGLGKTPQETAQELHISLKTVDTHKTKILDLCRNEWNVLPETKLDYRFLRDKFQWFYESGNENITNRKR